MSPQLLGHAARLAVLTAAAYYAIWGGEYSAFDLRSLEQMRADEEAALAVARSEVDSLRTWSASLEKDPAVIEKVARERFGMIRDGELLYRFVYVDTATARERRLAATP